MTGLQVLILIGVLAVLMVALAAVWLRKRRAGGVRIASASGAAHRRQEQP